MRRGNAGLLAAVLLAAAMLSAVAAAPPAVGGSISPSPAVAPYLDMGAYQPQLLYRAINNDHLKEFSAAFVIGRGCTPTWDDGVPVATDTAVNRVIAKAKSLGATVIVSFGGASGKDLARSCNDPTQLRAAYESVVTQLKPTEVDFDIEGVSLDEPATIKARFAAIAALETADPHLVVSLTEPVEPHGLDSQVKTLLKDATADGVRVDLLNLMTMDYGGGSIDMGAAAVTATKDALAQLRRIRPGSTYANLGITPMIGRNDNVHETFTLADAGRVARFARAHHVGRLAFWAMGRDQVCPTPHKQPQYNCSSVKQKPLAFTKVFLAR